MHQISHDACVFGNDDIDCIFNCPHRGQGMCVGSDPAGSLNEMVGIPWIAALKNQFDASEHLT
jgi:hypothetical protein